MATSITRDILNRFEEVDILNEDYEVSVLSLILKQLGLFNKMKTSMTKKKEKRLQHILNSVILLIQHTRLKKLTMLPQRMHDRMPH